MSKEAIIRLNPKQLLFHQTVTANQADYLKEGVGYQGGFRATFQGGRGSGKSRTLIHLLAESAFQLPRAKAGLAGLTFRQVQDIILSQSSSVFEEHGLHEYNSKTGFGHYVINRRPPEHWKSAWNTIRTYDNSLVFANGYTVQFVSADRPETIRGANFDQLLIDESATIKEEFYNKVLRPTVRANKHIYKDARPGRKGLNHPLHWLIADFTSVPWTPQGNWIFKTEELQKEKPGRYYFQEATAYDNLEFLPGSFIEDQREACGDELTFNMEILNQRLTRVGSGFYHSLDTARHVRYRVINGLLQETNIRLPKIRINETACKSLLISLQSAPIDGTTFEKIKLSERNKALPQEYATHLSDCFDYILFKKFSAYVTGSGVRTGGIVIR